MEKRLVLALALSILIIFTFQHLFVKPAPQVPPSTQAAPTENRQTGEPVNPPVLSTPPPGPSVEEKEVLVETDKYALTFSNVGGAIKTIRLKGHKDMGSGEPLDLVDIKNPKEYILAISDPLNAALLDSAAYNVVKKDGAVECVLRTQGFEITKRYILHNSKYIIELQLFVRNISSAPQQFNYRIIGGSNLTESNIQDKRFVEVTSSINGKVIGFKRPRKEERIINPGIVAWSALKNRYFSLILRPSSPAKNQFYSENRDGSLVMGVEPEAVVIQPGATAENKFLLYAGPSEISSLGEAGCGLEETVNYGFFGGIAKALIFAMKFFYRLVHSWGVSIIILSVFLNIILFPLTIKSFKSMQKMQELHPQMEKLKAQCKDNPQKLNKEIMELYKKNNINPFSGCLPMLLQMPVFIALYQALLKSIELRGSGFLWIKDLSMPDAVKIPISLPIIGNSINILPLFMVLTMVIQQRISTKTMGSAVTPEQKEQQRMMLIIMPIVFGFIFYSMPSGLVLYWVINTVLTIIEQSAILKQA